MNRVLTIAVHPDDETLGCGGSLLKHKSNGDAINWLIATTINESMEYSAERILKRKKEIELVSEAYGFEEVFQLNIQSTKVDEIAISQLIQMFSDVIIRVKPSVIYLPYFFDVHSDHRLISEATYSCTKSFRNNFIKKVLMMETLSETEFAPAINGHTFMPNYFVDITDFLIRKLEIMKIYEDEILEHPFPRSIENMKALATFRGAMANFKYGESFMLLKEFA
ncbi:MAG: PIG-L deacetylase family protein [Vulcanimicrobiota bacterium]